MLSRILTVSVNTTTSSRRKRLTRPDSMRIPDGRRTRCRLVERESGGGCVVLTSVFSCTCKVRPCPSVCIQCDRLGSGLECAKLARFGLLTSPPTDAPQGKTALINKLMAKVFGTSNEREIKRLMPLVERINALEPETKQLTEEQLRAKTDEFRKRIHERVDAIEDVDEKAAALKEVLDELLPEAFAVAREASWRVLKMRHFDVQL